MALYQLTLFYPNLRSQAVNVRKIRAVVEECAGHNWRVLSAGEQVCAIVFVTETPKDQLRKLLVGFEGSEQFQFLLIEVADPIQGFLSKDTWKWIQSHLGDKKA
ncbi:hypothetical protein CUZ56_00756 [Saezia sanguinis]|uniref:DUF3303 domain-containing protein n=1 Tax=Saezia sanguinis TaxID=1965230 RepID=A0A433SHR8_9BURK|nr:hypothetical protein [Saezia sanguinis]RUS68268.1 hypothetical protein CUZ56_00756 [Saezia sanguinis]